MNVKLNDNSNMGLHINIVLYHIIPHYRIYETAAISLAYFTRELSFSGNNKFMFILDLFRHPFEIGQVRKQIPQRLLEFCFITVEYNNRILKA